MILKGEIVFVWRIHKFIFHSGYAAEHEFVHLVVHDAEFSRYVNSIYDKLFVDEVAYLLWVELHVGCPFLLYLLNYFVHGMTDAYIEHVVA